MTIWKGYRSTFSPTKIPHKYYVYALRKTEDSKIFYVGKGSGYRARFHKNSPGNSAIKKVIKKFPEYYIEILSSSNNETAIFELERSYIRKFGKRVDSTGYLLNFSDGGSNTAKEFFKDDNIKEAYSLKMSKERGKPLFIDGFIFPSIRFAARKNSCDRNHIKYLLKIGRAFFLDEEAEFNHNKYLSYVESQILKYRNSVEKSSKQITTNRPVVIDGVIYPSTTAAAREHGVTQGAITNRIARGNQKNTYYLDEYYGQDVNIDV